MNDDKEPTIILEDLQEFDSENVVEQRQVAPATVSANNKVLWIDARTLTDNNFFEFEKIFQHYADGDRQIKIVRQEEGKNKVYALSNMQICNALLSEIEIYLPKTAIVEKE